MRQQYKMLTHRIKVTVSTQELLWQIKKHATLAINRKKKLICIVNVEHLGDIIACEPVARILRQRNPEAIILWLTKDFYAPLVKTFTHVDAVLTLECLTTWLRIKPRTVFDELYELHPHGKLCPICKIPLVKSTTNSHITTENYYDYGNLLQAFSNSANIHIEDLTPRLEISESVKLEICKKNIPESYVVIHTQSNESARDWQSERWQQLVDNLITNNINVVEIGITSSINCDATQYLCLCNKLSILETAEVIRGAKLFIGIDSGPAHIANAVGTFGIILMGHYRKFRQYCPYSGAYADGTNADLIQHDGLVHELPLNIVWASIIRRLSSSRADSDGS